MSKRRATIAKRLVEAQHTAAMLTTFNEVDMTAVQALRARRKEAFQKAHGVNLGLSSFFVKAAVGALKLFPRINAEIQGDEIVVWGDFMPNPVEVRYAWAYYSRWANLANAEDMAAAPFRAVVPPQQ